MKRIKILIVLYFVIQNVLGQENSELSFPESYLGTYTGDLTIYTKKGIKLFPMEFHLQPTDSTGIYHYMLVYGKDENRQERKYTLKEIDKSIGKYVVDENNGIILDCQVVENKMYFLFEVNSSLLTTFITFYNDHLFFEIIATDTNKKNTSGGQDEETPEVFSYPINIVQKAILNKQ